MIRYWQQEDGKLIEKDEEELDGRKSTWVDARSVTRDDIAELEEKYGIDPENMLDILDPDELSRLEKNDEFNYTLTILRLPVFSPVDDISYFCTPLGIIMKEKLFITICWTDCEVLKDFAANRIKELKLNDFPAFAIRFLSRSDTAFLRYLKELNRRATTIQNEMLRSVQNHELVQLLNIQKSLVYFSTSLKSNQMLLEKFRKTKLIKLDEDDQDWLDDVEIDNRQAMEMADTYSNIMATMNDAFASVLSNNLNIVMKTMTGWNLVLMVPTIISSYYGINVPLPWQNSGWAGAIIIFLASIFFSGVAYLAFMKRNITSISMKRKSVTKTGPSSFKKRKAIRQQKRDLMRQEKQAEAKK
ncbi:MAG: magnesium transporter CorA family protein [Treponema sp.]|jgi:magnesium transporter|nr:magnesium transporter CorA family protein [Treponema sp.]MBR6296703.1 magnesium transporter CorA family protein [Treponema sp.]MEE3312578.1 magnesium transporter CorA family protein [Treponema sp.]